MAARQSVCALSNEAGSALRQGLRGCRYLEGHTGVFRERGASAFDGPRKGATETDEIPKYLPIGGREV
jgi:hypothetical protein